MYFSLLLPETGKAASVQGEAGHRLVPHFNIAPAAHQSMVRSHLYLHRAQQSQVGKQQVIAMK